MKKCRRLLWHPWDTHTRTSPGAEFWRNRFRRTGAYSLVYQHALIVGPAHHSGKPAKLLRDHARLPSNSIRRVARKCASAEGANSVVNGEPVTISYIRFLHRDIEDPVRLVACASLLPVQIVVNDRWCQHRAHGADQRVESRRNTREISNESGRDYHRVGSCAYPIYHWLDQQPVLRIRERSDKRREGHLRHGWGPNGRRLPCAASGKRSQAQGGAYDDSVSKLTVDHDDCPGGRDLADGG